MLHSLLALLCFAGTAHGLALRVDQISPNNGSISPTSVTTSSGVFTQNNAAINQFPSTPLLFACNTNGYCQLVGQNLSNGTGASTDLSLTNDLGGDTSYYINVGINSSKFSQVSQSVEPSSSGYITTSDSALIIWSDINGLASGGLGHIILGSSNPITGNQAMDISSAAVAVTFGGIAASTATKANFLSNSTGTYILGTVSGDSAPAGYVGEYISTTPTTTGNLPASGADVSIATTTLTAGEWDINGNCAEDTGASTAQTELGCFISKTPNNADILTGDAYASAAFTATVSQNLYVPVGPRRIRVTSTTPIYLVGTAVYSALGGATWDGTRSFLRATRVR